MREVRRESLKDLLQLGDGRILAASRSGDRYWLVDDSAGTTDNITLQKAALLWQQGEREDWERLDRATSNTASADLFDATSTGGNSSGKSFRELLRERLAMTESE